MSLGLGYGNYTGAGSGNKTAPVQITLINNVKAVSAGYNSSMVLKHDDTVWGVGYNSYGQMGDGTTTSSYTVYKQAHPTEFIGTFLNLDHVKFDLDTLILPKPQDASISATITAKAYDVNGSEIVGCIPVISLKHNYNGVSLNSGTLSVSSNIEVEQITLVAQFDTKSCELIIDLKEITVKQVEAGNYHTLALSNDGTVWAWGRNNYGQLGNGTTIDSTIPVKVVGLSDVISISTQYEHNLALKSDGTVWAWGYNSYGRLGDGTTVNSPVPGSGQRYQ